MEPSPADQQRAIDALSDGTGMSRDDAAYYLMTNGWNAEMAASAFFAESEESEVVSSAPRAATAAPSAAVPLPTSRPTPKPKPAGGGKGGIRSLSDLKRGGGGGGSDDESGSDDDGDKMNEYYAGGEKSGMLVQAPKRRNEAPPSGGNALDSLIQAATRQGAEEQTERSQQQGHRKAFAGSGYRLGATDLGPSAAKPSGPSAAKPELRKKLVLWKQGFTVDDDGPLRLYGEPANEQFLAAVTAGRMPAELAQLEADVSLDVSDRRGEPYVAPAVPRPLFQGQGHTLGSSTSSTSATPSAAVKEQQPALTVTVDDTQPTTQLQIRLLDGSKIVAKFNTSHTVLHVRAYINREKPSKAAYVLSTAFPPLPISDESKTLQELGLLNSVLVQKAA